MTPPPAMMTFDMAVVYAFELSTSDTPDDLQYKACSFPKVSKNEDLVISSD
jgi:hypothetical protein